MQMLILLKPPPPKQVLIIKGTVALDLTAAKQLFVMSVLLPFSRCESEGADREGKARMRGRKTGLSEMDCSLQRANIKFCKYRYLMLNKVAAVRY